MLRFLLFLVHAARFGQHITLQNKMKYILGQWADNELKVHLNLFWFRFHCNSTQMHRYNFCLLSICILWPIHYTLYTVYSIHNKSTKRRESKAEIQIDNSEKVRQEEKQESNFPEF